VLDKSGQPMLWQTIAAMKRILIAIIALVAIFTFAILIRPHPRFAPPGVYFTLTHISARSASGITGFEPGTRVVCVKDEGSVLLIKVDNLEFEAKREYLTDDLDVADLAVRNDAEAQQAVASYIAEQQRAIDQREDMRKMQASGQH
jgi:hypothetical protein